MFYNKDIREIEKELNTSIDGLTDKEVKNRIEKYGKNTLPKKKKDSVFKIFFNELKDPIVLLLIVAIIASLIAGEIIDADAYTGGFNLQIAWSTAHAAAESF